MTIGAMREVAEIAKAEKVELETESGKTWKVPGFIGQGKQKDEENGGQSYVRSESTEALIRAERYLKRHVVGHIRNHLGYIHLNNGDPVSAADELKDNIDRLVDELTVLTQSDQQAVRG